MDKEDLKKQAQERINKEVITSQCSSCGISYSENFQWYRNHEFKCQVCGAPVDEAPFMDFIKKGFEKAKELRNQSEQP